MTSREQPNVVWRMRVELDPAALREPVWPEGVRVRTFQLGDANAVHSLLAHGYERRGGSVGPFEAWLAQMTADAEFDAELWFVAESEPMLVGTVLCWTSAFVKDLVVRESWRRRGLGEALLRHVFKAFATLGAPAVELKVESSNLTAVALYERLGMRIVERLEAS
jgi:ribosomal protein S18 acetylase RimI-like enzyme